MTGGENKGGGCLGSRLRGESKASRRRAKAYSLEGGLIGSPGG
jgi:hypothetical protein